MATTFDEFGNEIQVVTAEELVEQQNREFMAMGGADEDSGKAGVYYENDGTPSSNVAEQIYYENDGTPSSNVDPSVSQITQQNTKNAGTTVAGKGGNPAAKGTQTKPGIRTQNPLGNFSSYTYQLTLYMITPDAYDAFIASGRKNINAITNTASAQAANDYANSAAGVYLVAQSGGINNKTSMRAPGFNLDYYIDDLRITTATNGKSSLTSSNTTSMTFKILEPYGFSFITKLKTAAGMLQQYSKLKNYKNLENPSKQFFLLGIKFQGYDKDGNVVTGNSPGGSGSFEHFYDILLTSIKFKLDGKATTYTITAATTAPQTAYGTKRGRLLNDLTAVASTVEEALVGDGPGIQGIFTQINQQQVDMKNAGSIEIPNKYSVKFVGDKVSAIRNASVVTQYSDPDKTKWPLAPVKDTNQVNEKVSVTSSPDNTKKNILFKNDTPIQQVIQLLISQSDYIENALKVLYTTAAEPDESSDSPEDVKPRSNKTLSWYNVSAEIKNLGFDKKVNDFAYEITYIIQPYDTPVIMAFAAGKTTPYYGPHKRYDYWFTGKNSEIIEYSQSLDNSYFNVAIEAVGDSASTGGSTDIPLAAYKRQNVARQGRTGIGAEAANSYVNYLVDPGSYAQAKVSILGDPDFLVQDGISSINSLYNQFYGTDGFTINPNGGQVFIEIDFKEAVDYNNNTGTLDINSSILFWKYPPSIAKKIKGVSYMVIEVISNFSKGKFTQDLNCVINTFAGADGESSSGEGGRESANSPVTGQRTSSQQTGEGGNTPTGSTSTGLMQDDVTGVDEAIAQQEAENRAIEEANQADAFYNGNTGEITSPTGGFEENYPVQDDDASSDTPNYSGFDEGGREE